MDWEEHEKRIRIECESNGKTEEYVEKLIAYSKKLFIKGLPVITTPSHFSMLVGVDHNYVCSMAVVPSRFYRDYKIKKSNGKERAISEPLPDLMFVQHWILRNILEKCPVSKYAKAFVKKRTLKTNARFHLGQSVLVTLDVKDFFPSISFFDVFEIFKQMGYSEAVSRFLSNLCCYHNALPQGAPTSPYLSNLRMYLFDEEISSYISSHRIRYTRYADDMTFSGDFDPHKLIRDVSEILYRHGFKLNKDKTRVARKNTRQEVTGIVVNEYMQIPRQKRKEIRQQVYYIRRFGLESHLNHIQETRGNYLNHLMGLINFSLFVNPRDEEMKSYSVYIRQLISSAKTED